MLHAVVLYCVFGLQPQLKPHSEGAVLMAQWVSAENAVKDAPVVQAQEERKPIVKSVKVEPAQPSVSRPKTAQVEKTNVKPPQASVLTAERSEQFEAKPESRVENRTEGANQSVAEPSREEAKPIANPIAKPIQAAYTPAAGGKPAAMTSMNPDYLTELFRKLARHKVYPSELKKNKIEGRVVVKFTLAADGKVISSSIQQSSGNDSLDDAALQVLNKASPLPAIPSYMNRSEMTLAVPVEYSLLTDR